MFVTLKMSNIMLSDEVYIFLNVYIYTHVYMPEVTFLNK